MAFAASTGDPSDAWLRLGLSTLPILFHVSAAQREICATGHSCLSDLPVPSAGLNSPPSTADGSSGESRASSSRFLEARLIRRAGAATSPFHASAALSALWPRWMAG